jgi:phage shock protein A
MESFYDANVRRVADSRKTNLGDEDLVAAFMTIEDLIHVYYDPRMNLVRDIGEQNIIDLMVDVKKIINSIRSFKGNQSRGTREAKEIMYRVSERLYYAQTAVHNGSPDRMAVEMLACVNMLDEAFTCLQHLESQAQEIRRSNNHPQQEI